MCASNVTLPQPLFRASATSPFAPGCDGVAATGTLYENAEVEPMVAVNPANPNNLVGVWQQDRWSDGGAHGLLTGFSFDGGRTWARTSAAFSRCAGGNVANGGDY
ncbi:MAG TPA: exo-alpha-sialidase, partial [Casimicrobiaceae bacterium]